MEKVGILVVCYGSRGVAIADAFKRSLEYETDLYIVDRQKNPFNARIAKEHIVIPDLNVNEICKFVKKREREIDFGIVGPEKPIIEGIRDLIEAETEIPLICPTKKFAIEASKVEQRKLFQKAIPEVNPKFKVFDPADYRDVSEVKREVWSWLDELNNQAVVKPDKPAAGKGVGVWGDHFRSREELFEHFLANFMYGRVIIEEKLEGEESSFQCFCDGKRIVPLPETRDYKRAFEGDEGPNTGGMGSYKDTGNILPFMTERDWDKEIEIANKIFYELRGKTSNPELRGTPFYIAFIHTAEGPKILENNSRPGDPEIMNVLPLLKDDFVDLCMRMIDGNLKEPKIEDLASVVIYKVPPTYGGFNERFPEKVRREELGSPVDLSSAEKLVEKYGGRLRLYPGSMEVRDGETYALRSRAVAAVGLGDGIAEARKIALECVEAIRGGALWFRKDIASKEHISRSIERMKTLRKRGGRDKA